MESFVLWRNGALGAACLKTDRLTIDRTNGYDFENGPVFITAYSCVGSDGKYAYHECVASIWNLTLNLGCLIARSMNTSSGCERFESILNP